MNTGLATFRSLLDKPLHELTEEDIAQVTREDCRRYLKQKGMRRPSWNKSQAIQQVISLKTLLGTTESSDGGAPPYVLPPAPEIPPHVTSNSADWVKKRSAGKVEISANVSSKLAEHTVDTDSKAFSPRTENVCNWSVGKMTIFYCGKVNVYDGVPVRKARAIMHLAATPTLCLQDDRCGRTAAFWSSPCPLQTTSFELRPILSEANKSSPGMQTDKMIVCPQQYREEEKASRETGSDASKNIVTKILGKAKDRMQTLNVQFSQSSTGFPPQPGQPTTTCNLADNRAKNAGLNENDMQEN